MSRPVFAIALTILATAAAAATPQTRAQFEARQTARLMAADADGDGRISRAEFIAAAKAQRGDPARRFDRMDSDHDGYLDKAERDAMTARRFARIDRNGDGTIAPDERAAAHAPRAAPGG